MPTRQQMIDALLNAGLTADELCGISQSALRSLYRAMPKSRRG